GRVLRRREKHLPWWRRGQLSAVAHDREQRDRLGVRVAELSGRRAAPGRGHLDRAGDRRRGRFATDARPNRLVVRTAVRRVVLVWMLLERCPSSSGAAADRAVPAARG